VRDIVGIKLEPLLARLRQRFGNVAVATVSTTTCVCSTLL
jgi:hypothetical protein